MHVSDLVDDNDGTTVSNRAVKVAGGSVVYFLMWRSVCSYQIGRWKGSIYAFNIQKHS